MNKAATVVNLLLETDPKSVKGFLRRSGVMSSYYLDPPGTRDPLTGKPVVKHVVRDATSCKWLGVIEGEQFTFDLKPDHWVVTQAPIASLADFGRFFKTREEAAAHLWHRWRNSKEK